MKAAVSTSTGTKVVTIKPADVAFSPKEEEKMTKRFNKDTRVLEFVGGVTYFVTFAGKTKTHRLKSSSLDELLEMYKCAWKGKAIPERKCFFHK